MSLNISIFHHKRDMIFRYRLKMCIIDTARVGISRTHTIFSFRVIIGASSVRELRRQIFKKANHICKLAQFASNLL